MQNHVQPGVVLTITNTTSEDIASGDFVVIGYLFGVACGDIPAGEDGEIQTEEVFDLPKDATVFAVGDRVEWDASAGKMTASGSGSILIGIATKIALTGATTVRVKLGSFGIAGA
jgi:predicted RecA/RadA family phage recombinase